MTFPIIKAVVTVVVVLAFTLADARRLGNALTHHEKHPHLLYFNLRSAGTVLSEEDWCIDAHKESKSEVRKIILNPCVDSPTQKFITDGSNRIRSGIDLQLCLDVKKKKVKQNAELILSPCVSEKRQYWNIDETTGAIHSIKHSDFCLTAGKFRKRAPIAVGKCPTQYEKHTTWSRVFVIEKDEKNDEQPGADDDDERDFTDDLFDDSLEPSDETDSKQNILSVDDNGSNDMFEGADDFSKLGDDDGFSKANKNNKKTSSIDDEEPGTKDQADDDDTEEFEDDLFDDSEETTDKNDSKQPDSADNPKEADDTDTNTYNKILDLDDNFKFTII